MLEKWLIAFNMFFAGVLGIAICILNNNFVDLDRRIIVLEAQVNSQCSFTIGEDN